jgi:hypothetical protein
MRKPICDAFIGLLTPQTVIEVKQDQQSDSPMFLEQPLDLITATDFKMKRSRMWKRYHRSETVTPRGIPKQRNAEVAQLVDPLTYYC